MSKTDTFLEHIYNSYVELKWWQFIKRRKQLDFILTILVSKVLEEINE